MEILERISISWAGHIWRSEGQLQRKITMWKQTKKLRWRPRQRYNSRVKEDPKFLGIRDGKQIAKDRADICSVIDDGLYTI